MSSEHLHPRNPEDTAEGLLKNPPVLILPFDNYRGPSNRYTAKLTMELRAAMAALLYHSDLYPSDQARPIICCFAGPHTKGAVSGSELVAERLLHHKVPADKIITRQTTITTTTDIMQLHSLVKQLHIEGSVAIVTTEDHVRRTEQELVNHSLDHTSSRHMPLVYIIHPSAPEIATLRKTKINSKKYDDNDIAIANIIAALGTKKELDHGFSEKVAYLVASNTFLRSHFQDLAERIFHPYTPPKLVWIRQTHKRFKKPSDKV